MIKGLKAMLTLGGGEDICIQEAIQLIEKHVNAVVQDPSYEIPLDVFRLRQAQFKVCVNKLCSNLPGEEKLSGLSCIFAGQAQRQEEKSN
jgi:hypothetical protein